jgi:hypothetical protein
MCESLVSKCKETVTAVPLNDCTSFMKTELSSVAVLHLIPEQKGGRVSMQSEPPEHSNLERKGKQD